MKMDRPENSVFSPTVRISSLHTILIKYIQNMFTCYHQYNTFHYRKYLNEIYCIGVCS